MNKQIDLQITGMHCQSCEILIKEELSELSGISEINVDHKTGIANLVLDETKSSTDAILAAVSKAGYTATFASKKSEKKEKASTGNIYNSSSQTTAATAKTNESGVKRVQLSLS